jgi:molecular chaperone GrpE
MEDKQNSDKEDFDNGSNNTEGDINQEISDNINSTELDKEEDLSKDKMQRIQELEEKNKELRSSLKNQKNILEETKRKNNQKLDELEKSLTEDFVQKFSELRFSLDKAIEKSEADCNIRSSLVTTTNSIDQFLENKGVKIIDPQKGNQFNPDLHMAINSENRTEFEENKILEVHREGYIYNGKVLQYAKVTVTN